MRFTRKTKSNIIQRICRVKVFITLTTFISLASTATLLFNQRINYRSTLWNGEAIRSTSLPDRDGAMLASKDEHSVKTIEIVVAYCSADVTWLSDIITQDFYNASERKIVLTILSKCGNHESITQFLKEKFVHFDITVHTHQLPNKGGCDLAYAHFINEYIKSGIDSSSTILFLKDTPRTKHNCHQKGRYRTIPEMLHFASHGEFICGVKAACGRSAYHDVTVLKTFTKNGYKRHGDGKVGTGDDFNAENYISLDDFMTRELKWKFPNDAVTEVCYGGSFGIPASRLFADSRLKQDFLRLEEILLEGPAMSVVEHFAERLWASFLAKPLDKFDTEVILQSAGSTHQEQERYMGTLLHSSIFHCFFGD